MNRWGKSQWRTLCYYVLGSLFTYWFIITSPFTLTPLYILLSNVIAGSKWAIQIIAAFIFLREQRWDFIKNIGFVYFIGSCLLLPYIMLSYTGINNDVSFYSGSHLISVMVMIFCYYRAVELSELKLAWWLAWLACQIIGILLQITLVFRAL
jgi:hypothetical protein